MWLSVCVAGSMFKAAASLAFRWSLRHSSLHSRVFVEFPSLVFEARH
jgi:hypothetical protein